MKQISPKQAHRAQQELQRALESVFGPKLSGVNGFGAGLDHVTREMSLQVTVDGPSSERRAAALPDTIEGLPVKVWQRGPAKAD
jgi:hypothetical protein